MGQNKQGLISFGIICYLLFWFVAHFAGTPL